MPGLALAIVVLMAVVVSASAWLRLAQPRVPCTDWPACRVGMARVVLVAPLSSATGLAAPRALEAVRGVHRVAATAALLLVCGLVGLALLERPRRPQVWRPALGLLVLALGLAALGVITPGSRAVGVLLGNLLGGFAMAALAWLLVRRLSGTPSLERGLARQAGVLCGLWAVQAALGALSGAGLLSLAPQLHLLLAGILLLWAPILCWRVARAGRRGSGIALAVVCVIQMLLGFVAVALDATPSAVVLHNAIAALGAALLLDLALAGTQRGEALKA